MSKMTKEQATDRARRLMRRVKGKGWTMQIHENIGWHFCLKLGELKLYEMEDKGRYFYSTLMGDYRNCSGGVTYFRVTEANCKELGLKRFLISDPNDAVRVQLIVARRWVDSYTREANRVVSAVEDAFGEAPRPGWFGPKRKVRK
jgi:hypothetical protein